MNYDLDSTSNLFYHMDLLNNLAQTQSKDPPNDYRFGQRQRQTEQFINNHIPIQIFSEEFEQINDKNFQIRDIYESQSEGQRCPYEEQPVFLSEQIDANQMKIMMEPFSCLFSTDSKNKAKGQGAKRRKQFSKGLRNLSEFVYRVVVKFQNPSYNQVVQKLIEMMEKGEFWATQNQQQKIRNQRNIKRRVYDALNVFAAANLLTKEKYFVRPNYQAWKGYKLGSNSKKFQTLKSSVMKKMATVQQKREIISELKRKRQILLAILKRNKRNKNQQNSKIYFPIIGISYIQKAPEIVFGDKSHTKIKIETKGISSMVGDMDLLMKIGIDVFGMQINQIIHEQSDQEIKNDSMSNSKQKTESVVTTVAKQVKQVKPLIQTKLNFTKKLLYQL